MSSYNEYQCWPQESTSNTDDDELSSPEIEQGDSDEDTESSTSSTSTSATSSSDSSQSGSDSETTSTADEDETILLKTETALANKTELSLPAGMCEDEDIFKQLFSVNSWVCLSDQQKQHLKNFLPKFSENDLMEKEITLRMLFGGQSFRFGINPIDDFHDKLKTGHFRPDVVKMKSLLRRSLKREYRKNQRIYSFNMLKKLLSGRKKVIDDLNGFSTSPLTNNCNSNSYTMHQQVRRRYFRELYDIKQLVGDDSEDSSDSNYQEGPPTRLSKKQRRHLSVVQNSLSSELESVTPTLATYPDGLDLSKVALPLSNPFDPTEEMYREMLISHKKKQKKIEQEQEQKQFDLIKERIKPNISLAPEKKRSAASDRPRVKRTKTSKQQLTQSIQPPVNMDVKPPVQLSEFQCIPIKQERAKSEPHDILHIKEEVLEEENLPPSQLSPPLSALSPPVLLPPLSSSPPSISLPEISEEESIKTNLDAIKLETSLPIDTGIVNIKEEVMIHRPIKIEPVSLTADEIRKAEEGQAAAAMLLEQMSDVEQKYNSPSPPPPLSPPPPPTPPPRSTSSSPSTPTLPECTSDSKFSPSNFIIKREFHPEDMLTSTVPSLNTESPPKMLNSCLRSSTPSDYGGSRQLSLSPVSTPSKVILDSNYVGALSELEGFHVLDIKSECTEEVNMKPLPITKKMTVSFFALIRDIICSTWDYRMNMTALVERIDEWVNLTINNQMNPDWYHSLALKSWPKALHSAIGFLAGHFPEWQPEDFVPFIEYKPSLDTYQWIGAGRDSDTRLGELCKCWLNNLNNISSKFQSVIEEVFSIKSLPIQSTIDVVSKIETSETDLSMSLPTPLLDTWIVTPSSVEERAIFQAQEQQRFSKPHRSFIYRMHGYESIVGPVRGIYNSSNIHKAARGHSLLIENRPHFISILVLVRDSTARLPNGMGTRSDICTLLKDSQYLMEANQTELHNAVSGALDRLHYEHDPCVKYDPKRKIWIYLHRGRTMEEFERLHLEQQGAVKTKCWRRNKIQKKSPEPKRTLVKKSTSNVLLESLSMLDLPTNSTSDSMLSSSTSPVLSDMNVRVSQEMTSIENSKQPIKTSRNVKNRKMPVQLLQTTDNAVEFNIECPTVIDNKNTETSQLFAMPVSSNISTVATSNSLTITTSNIISQSSSLSSQSIASILSSKSAASNISCKSISSNISCQALANNITNQSIANNITSQPITNNITNQSIVNNITNQSIVNNITNQSIVNNIANQSIVNNITNQSIASNLTSQSIASKITSHSVSSNIISQSIANTNLKFVNTQPVVNSGQMINIAHSMSSNNQTLVNSNKMVVNSISSNNQLISSGDLITIGSRKKTKHVQIAQPVNIGPSSGSTNFQHDHHLTLTKTHQNLEPQRQILVLKQKRSDHSISNTDQTTTVVNQTDTVKTQTLQQFIQMQQQQKLLKQQQMQLKLLQRKQVQQQTLQQKKQQIIIRNSDADDKSEISDAEHPQVIFVKQGPRGVPTEAQQITQQQLQQLLMMRPQQQTGQQTQVVMVKQSGSDQKPIALKPLLTSLRGTKIQQTAKATNLLLQANQAGQSVHRRITKPIVGKLVTNSRSQLPIDSVLANRKLPVVSQGTSLRISGVQTSKSGQPQYTVVTVAQPKLIPSNQLNIGQTPTRLSALNDRLKSVDTNQPQTLRVVQSQIGGKPVLVTNKAQISTALTSISTSSNIVSSSASSTANTYTVLQQGSQQILVPASSLKSIQGLKVIPLSQHNVKGRSQMYARIVNPDGIRPMFIHQPSNQDTSQGPSESNT